MDAEEALLKLKREYPEIEEHIIQEALRNNDYDFRRTSEALRARFYSEDAGIPQEQSLWSSLGVNFGGAPSGTQTSNAQSDWDFSLDSLTDSINAVGAQLLMGVEAVADTLGSIGDLIPDLIFGEEEYYEDGEGPQTGSRGSAQVVVGGTRTAAVKKRGHQKVESPPPPRVARDEEEQEYGTDEETDDWTKED